MADSEPQGTSSWPTDPTDGDTRRELPPMPSRLGRYAVLRTLGAGGMGVVYAAYDEELERRVAIKVLHPRFSEDGESRARILREAQAMAKVSHPNVASLHEVDVEDRRLFVVMEFVDGPTLGGWLTAAPRSEREILEVYRQAGRGLAAAHAAGLVHRDFKPDNALVGRDGRVRVVDFGLARASGAPDPASGRSSPNLLIRPLTRPGALAGTPAYMSPEQHGSASFDARSDQYAFCVALWEALMGERPFAGDTVTALMHSVRSGQFTRPATDRDVSPALLRTLRRGLAAEPEERWPSMDDLLLALAVDSSHETSDTPRSRRRFAFALIAAGYMCTLVAVLALAGGGRMTLTLTVLPPTLVLAAIGLASLLLRRSLLRNRLHRRVIIVVVVALTSSTCARALGWLAGMSAHELLVVDLVVEGGIGTMAALFVARWFMVMVPMSLIVALASALVPEHALTIASVYFPAVTIVLLLLWGRASRARGRHHGPA